MPALDEYLRHELRRTIRPTDTNDVSSRIDQRRSRRARTRKIQTAALTVIVVAGSIGGFVALSSVFREAAPTRGGAAPAIENGLIVYSDVRNAGEHLWVVEPDGTGARQLTTGDGSSDTGPALSPDGRTVAFTRTDQHGSAIYTIGIDGTGLTQLIGAPATDLDPAWSPDGSQIAFAGSPGGPYGIYVIGADGSNTRIVKGTGEISVGHPAWSPDGGSIAFEGTGGAPEAGATWDIYVAPVDGTGLIDITQTPDTNELSPSWSPDGTTILFTRAAVSSSGGSALVTMAPEAGTTPTSLTDGSELDQHPAWSPDGRFIVFDRSTAAGTDVYSMRPDGSALTLVAINATDPAWQPILPGMATLAKVSLPGDLSAMRLAIGQGAVWALGSKNQAGPSVLLRIDPATDQAVATIPLEPQPWYLAAGGGAVWVGSPRSNALQRVDAATNEVTAQIQLPGDGVSGMAADDQGVWVEVTKDRSSQGGQNLVSLVRIDAQTSAVVATIPLEGLSGYDDEVSIGAGAVWVAGANLTGPSEERGADLVRIDPTTNTISAVITVSAFSVRAGPDSVWVTSPADGVNDSLHKPESWVAQEIDPTTNQVSAPIALPAAVSAVLAVTKDGVWFSGYDDQGQIHPVRFQGGVFDSSVPPIDSIYSDMAFDEASGTIWIAAISGLERIDFG